MQKKIKFRWPFTKIQQDGKSSTPSMPTPVDTPLAKWYHSITTLPLFKFIECLVDKNLLALTISGIPNPDQLSLAWNLILQEYGDAMGTAEHRAYLTLFNEICQLNIKLQTIEDMVMLMRKKDCVNEYGRAYYGGFADRLNKLLATSFKFDHNYPDDYEKELSRCVNRSKGILLTLDLKQLSFEKLKEKQNGEKTKEPTREYFIEWLLRLSNHVEFQVHDTITVYEFCSRVKAYNKYAEALELQAKKK